MTDFLQNTAVLNGCLPPTTEDIREFMAYTTSHTSSFNLLGVEQYDAGQVVPYDDPWLQAWLDERIKYAKKKKIRFVQPAECLIGQGGLGSCTSASGTGAQMCAVYNLRYFGVPAIFERLNCSVAYLKARGSWGHGLAVPKFQKCLMEFGNASVRSAGEYSTKSPGRTTGFDNMDYQVWTCNCANLTQVKKFLDAGVPVAFGSHTCPRTVSGGRVTSWRGANHAMQFSGADHDPSSKFFGMYRWLNTWSKIYDDPDNGWGCWMTDSEMTKFSMFGKFGLPYAILAPEFKVGIN